MYLLKEYVMVVLLILEFQDSKANVLPHFLSNGQGELQTPWGNSRRSVTSLGLAKLLYRLMEEV